MLLQQYLMIELVPDRYQELGASTGAVGIILKVHGSIDDFYRVRRRKIFDIRHLYL